MIRRHVLEIVQAEMSRTDENIDEPTMSDYLADLVRRLNNELPVSARYFPGDRDGAGGLL